MPEAQQWTEERLEMLKSLWEEGLSISQIGEKLGVSRNAIAGKVHRLGLKKRQSPISNKGTTKSKAPEKKATQQVVMPENLPLKLALRNINWSRARCSWPIGDPKSTSFKFCGAPVVAGKPYCNAHCFEAYTTNREQGGS